MKSLFLLLAFIPSLYAHKFQLERHKVIYDPNFVEEYSSYYLRNIVEDNTEHNYVYTIPVTVGTPGQSSIFVVNINSADNFVYSVDMEDATLRRHMFSGFYNVNDSSTAVLYNDVLTNNLTQCGITVRGYEYTDQFCIQGNPNTEAS